jgi:glycosyltransferase involved in cell wall biosynthesis
MKVTVLSHNLSSNAVMRAHRLARAAEKFAEVKLIGPVERRGRWAALPHQPWIKEVAKGRFPKFHASFVELIDAADGDVLIAVKPQLSSFGAALVAGEHRQVPIILDVDDLDIAFVPRSSWTADSPATDLSRPGSAIYLSLLTKAAGAASAVTVASSALQGRFGGTVVYHGVDTALFDPGRIDREEARRRFGFSGPTVLFAGKPQAHKGIEQLALALSKPPGVRLAVTCPPGVLDGPQWRCLPIVRLPMVPYDSLPELLAAADLVALPQLDVEVAHYQMPMKVFDAMAMGRPIVASAISDLPTVLNGCGRLVPPGGVDELAAAIVELLADNRELCAMGARARTRCQQEYSIDRTAETLYRVIGEITTVTENSARGPKE